MTVLYVLTVLFIPLLLLRYILDDLEGAEGTQFPSRGYYHDFYSKTTEQMERGFRPKPDTLHPTDYTLHPTPCTLHTYPNNHWM